MPTAIEQALTQLLGGQRLGRGAVEAAIGAVLDPDANEVDIAALLTAMSSRRPDAETLAGAATALRARATRIEPQTSPLLDTCGTGGTGLSTVNISTATAIVASACGISVAKHGNRGATSKSGSADVLEALGVNLDRPPAQVAACIDAIGIGFLYARALHPAMRAVAPVRRRLPFRTVFNLIGPLSNPAGASHQLIGTGRDSQADTLAQAAALLGHERTVVVCGGDRLDEVTLHGPTTWRLVQNGTIEAGQWQPSDFGLDPVPLESLTIDSPQQSAQMLRAIFAGDSLPAARVVLANTAAALWTMQRVDTVAAGVELAREALTTGAALAQLQSLIDFT